MRYNEKTAIHWLKKMNFPFLRTGSREVCDPPVMDTDVDFVFLCNESLMDIENAGWTETTGDDTSYGEDLDFRTFRSGEVNLIMVHNHVDFTKWKVATAAAKHLNLIDKQSRIELFQGVLYGNWRH